MKDLFKKLIIDSQEREFPKLVSRKLNIPLQTQKIVSLIGVRRSGKTYVLYDIINKLRTSVDRQNMLFINFEDDRLYPLHLQDLDQLIEAFFELYPQKRKEKIYVFLDEVQDVSGWELFVRRIYDNFDIQLFITGSSSKLLSHEIASSLRGRTISYEIFPFSFEEYLQFKNIEINLNSSNSISYIKNAFESYLFFGGFAETFNENDEVKKKIIKNYLDLIIYKDISDRYSLKNNSLLKHLIKYLLVNMGTLISFNKLYNEYKSQGFKIAKDTIYEYILHLQESYTFFTVPVFRNSIKEEQRHPRKLYAIDTSFKQLFDFSFSKDYSKRLENVVFLHLRRKTEEIYYFKQKQEIDFYVQLEQPYLINVSYQLSDEQTRKREIDSLVEGMNYFNLSSAFIITSDTEEIIETDGKQIFVFPIWKWLLTELN